MLGVATFTAVIVALHPARTRLLVAEHRPDRALAALAAVAASLACIYAEQMAAERRPGVAGDETHGFEHWTAQSALAICLVLLVALRALRTEGWRAPGASAAAGAVILGGLASIAGGGVPGGFSIGWAIAAVAWGTLVGLMVVATD